MQRRSENGQPEKGQSANRPKARNAPTGQESTDRSTEQFNRLKRERDEAREQRAATAEILRVIRASPNDVQPVFETIVRNAVSLCGGLFANVFRFDGELLHYVASHNVDPSYADMIRARYPMRPDSSQVSGRVVLTKSVVWLEDALTDPNYDQRYPVAMGWRRLLGVPMLREGEPIGAITVGWAEPGPASKVEEELLKTFADQAVIAIENARLLNELRQRTDDLSESLEQQTATSEVLKVISSSPGELKPVFDALLANAVRICDAKFGVLFLTEGDAFRYVALHGAPPAFAEARRREPVTRVKPGTTIGRVAATKKPAQTADIRAEPAYTSDPERYPILELAGARTILGVPMLKESQLVGAIVIYRQEVRPFTDKQIDLLSNFAAQAVIAIENTRLLNELRESLQQQTATADVLKVISRSTFDLQTVLDVLTESAARLCTADIANIWLVEGSASRLAASYQAIETKQKDYLMNLSLGPSRGSCVGRTLLDAKIVHIHDIYDDPEYELETSKLEGYRTMLGVPLLREGAPIGVLALVRSVRQPFTPQQIELVNTFASQAVIAIENARLLNELRELLQQQTATADVLKVISSSPGELEPVFEAMLQNATRICEAKFGTIFRYDGEFLHWVAGVDTPPALLEFQKKRGPYLPESGTLLDLVLQTREVAHSSDYAAEPFRGHAATLGGARSTVAVPMLKDSELVGAIIIYRQEVKAFTDKQIELVQNFASQAVIAIENTRLLNELRERTDDLTEALEQQTATSDVLRVISSSPTNVQPVFDAIAESAVRLCDGQFSFVVRFDGKVMDFASCCGLSAEGLDAFHSILPMAASEHTAAGRAIVRRAVVAISDVETDPSYGAQAQGLAKAVTYRSIAAVPLLNEGNPIGAIAVARANAGSFPKRQIVLLQAFADQAVIAIANVRLFDEVQARTRELAKSLDDLRTTQDRLVQTQKLASLGQLTAGIAHEIKNPLNFVNNFSGLSSELIDELQEALGDVSLIEKRHS